MAFPRALQSLDGQLGETLCVVTSKSGGTPETRNGMLLVAEAYRAAGLEFPRHAVAITMAGSQMDKIATSTKAGWPAFRCSTGSADEPACCPRSVCCRRHCKGWISTDCWAGPPPATRPRACTTLRSNPAALMALMWYHATGGKGQKDMVVLPYKDRLLLFSRYLQQLIMESLGKQLDLHGRARRSGAHGLRQQRLDRSACVRPATARRRAQLLRRVHPRAGIGRVDQEVEPGVTAGDYLHGFLLGTRAALFENGRESMTITVPRVDARIVGALIALFERAVGLLCQSDRRQRLSSAGRRGRKEGGGLNPDLARQGARRAFADASNSEQDCSSNRGPRRR